MISERTNEIFWVGDFMTPIPARLKIKVKKIPGESITGTNP